MFSMNLRYKDLYIYSKVSSIVLNCALERLPQFIIQLAYIKHYGNDAVTLTAMAFLTSIIGVILTFLNLLVLICFTNHYRDERISLTFEFNLGDKKYDQPIKHVFAMRRKISKLVAGALGFEDLLCQYNTHHKDGNRKEMEMVFEILSNDDNKHITDNPAIIDQRLQKNARLIESINEMLDDACEYHFEMNRKKYTKGSFYVQQMQATVFKSTTEQSVSKADPHTNDDNNEPKKHTKCS